MLRPPCRTHHPTRPTIAQPYRRQTRTRINHDSYKAEMTFWNIAIAIVSSKQSLTKAHGRLLEHWAIQRATAAGRYAIRNATSPAKPPTPEAMEAECEDVFSVATTLLNTLGFPVFEPYLHVSPPNTGAAPKKFEENSVHLRGTEFRYRGRDFDARMVYTTDGCIVLRGSVARARVADSVSWLEEKRQKSVRDGVLQTAAHGLEFMRDHAFRTPSGAAQFVAGMSVNGWTAWLDPSGRTLDEVVRVSATT